MGPLQGLSGVNLGPLSGYFADMMKGPLAAVQDPEYWRMVRGNFGEAARGAARGISTNMLGAPVDLVNTAYIPLMGAIGKPIGPAQTVGSSAWFAQQGDKRGLLPTGDSVPFKAGETLGPIAAGAAPDALGLMTAGAGKVADVASQMASDYVRTQGPVFGQIGAITYHGSPHKFDAFDISKIGTGEGAQAYGHGLYVAENPGVAKNYADTLGGGKRVTVDPEVDQKVAALIPEAMKNFENDPKSAAEMLRAKAENLDEVLARGDGDAIDAALSARYKEAAAVVEAGKAKITQPNLYTVDLPDEHIARMLDWDKPLSEQAHVLKALDEAGYDPKWVEQFKGHPGAEIYKSLAGGEHVEDFRPSASNELLKYGIPGIKYLDAGSRSAGEGSRNYVVFDDKLLKILERNGMKVGE